MDKATENMAVMLHRAYEHAARGEGWDTQDSCKVPFTELPPENRATMMKVAATVLAWHGSKTDKLRARVKELEDDRTKLLGAIESIYGFRDADVEPWIDEAIAIWRAMEANNE